MAEHLRDDELCEVTCVGTPDGLEASLAEAAGLPFVGVPAKGFDRGAPLTLVSAAAVAIASWVRCMLILRRLRPDVVIGFGGYVSVPVSLAAALAGIPLVLHEQNAVPGLANRLLSRWATAVCVTQPESIAALAHPQRAHVTGNPVRAAVVTADRAAGRRALKLKETDVLLLVFGGSRGARHLNTAMLSLYQRLRNIPDVRVMHVAGPTEAQAVRDSLTEIDARQRTFWRVFDYVEEMGDALAAADLVVCRAGATTIAELAVVGRPAVLVPYPYATDDHQTRNAAALASRGAASVVADSDLDTPRFGDELVRLLTHPQARDEMAREAARLGRPLAGHAVAEVALEAAVARRRRMGSAVAGAEPSDGADVSDAG